MKIGQKMVEKWLIFVKHSIWAQTAKSMCCINLLKTVSNQFKNKILWRKCLARIMFCLIKNFYFWSKKMTLLSKVIWNSYKIQFFTALMKIVYKIDIWCIYTTNMKSKLNRHLDNKIGWINAKNTTFPKIVNIFHELHAKIEISDQHMNQNFT